MPVSYEISGQNEIGFCVDDDTFMVVEEEHISMVKMSGGQKNIIYSLKGPISGAGLALAGDRYLIVCYDDGSIEILENKLLISAVVERL